MLSAREEKSDHAAEDHKVGKIERGAPEEDEIIDGKAVDQAIKQVPCSTEENHEGRGREEALVAPFSDDRDEKQNTNQDGESNHERSAEWNVKGDTEILMHGPAARERGPFQNLVEQNDEACEHDHSSGADLHTSWVSVFLQLMHEVEVGRARSRRSSIGCLQYLQMP